GGCPPRRLPLDHPRPAMPRRIPLAALCLLTAVSAAPALEAGLAPAGRPAGRPAEPLPDRPAGRPQGPAVSYRRDGTPLLPGGAQAGHGPDEGKRKAKLRLAVRDVAVKKAVKPGDAAGSPLIRRVSSTDEEEVMPPPHAKKPPLTAAEIDLMRRWIDQGAKF